MSEIVSNIEKTGDNETWEIIAEITNQSTNVHNITVPSLKQYKKIAMGLRYQFGGEGGTRGSISNISMLSMDIFKDKHYGIQSDFYADGKRSFANLFYSSDTQLEMISSLNISSPLYVVVIGIK